MNPFPEAPKPPCPADTALYLSVLPRLRAGTLSEPERDALRRHLLFCAVCREQAMLAADQVVEESVRRHYGVPTDVPSFLTLDAIRDRAAQYPADEANPPYTKPVRLYDGEKSMTINDDQLQAPAHDERNAPAIKIPSPWRNVAAVTSAVAIIALFAALLYSFAGGKGFFGPAGRGGTATIGTQVHQTSSQTPQANAHGQWHVADSMSYTTQEFPGTPHPMFSPVNPAIVYQATENPFTVRRSDDSGATWSALHLPADANQAIGIEIFASSLDAHTAFLTVTTNLAYGQGPDACPSSAHGPVGFGTHGPVLASGQMPCSTTYRTTNDGATWTAIRFPVNGTISTPFSEAGPTAGSAATLLQAQGTRLFALLTCGPTCGGGMGRLVRSTDGGATWSVADGGGLGQGVCDFATQPNSQTVFAAVSSGSCDTINAPALSLYRSDNAGRTWSSVSTLPQGGTSEGMAVVIVGGKPLLVMNMPTVSWQPHIIGVSLSVSEFRVSSDGGHTWVSSPLQGVPEKAKPVITPLIVQADGSLIVAFSPSGDGQNAMLYSWKPGQTSWRVFAPAPNGTLKTLLHTVAPSGDETFWAVIQGSFADQNVSLTVEKYQP